MSAIAVITGEVVYKYDELDEKTWERIIEKALASLGSLKNVSGFKPFSEFLDVSLGRRSRRIIDPEKMQFYADELGPNSLCRKMATVYSSGAGGRKDEQEIFFLKDGRFALLAGHYIYSFVPILGGGSEWRAFSASLQPLDKKDLPVMSAKSGNSCMFWAELFHSIYDLAMEDRDLKRARADLARAHFLEIDAMKSKILLPEGS
ncbi:MAG: hypothetical protein Q7S36_01510 [Candidatus Liptonbacteria bacterium]|nr:hypothetical protein [Candidatus Liptonbacteria bacterium]